MFVAVFVFVHQAGSVTTFTNLNPGFRVSYYDRTLPRPFLVDDFDDHWIDLNQTNANPDLPPQW
jgi:hypothetical protein